MRGMARGTQESSHCIPGLSAHLTTPCHPQCLEPQQTLQILWHGSARSSVSPMKGLGIVISSTLQVQAPLPMSGNTLSNLLVSPLAFCLCLWVYRFLFFCCHLNWIKEGKKIKVREHSAMFNQKRSSWTLKGLGDNMWPSDCSDYPSDSPEPVSILGSFLKRQTLWVTLVVFSGPTTIDICWMN